VVRKIAAMVNAGQDLEPLHQTIGAGLLSNVQLGFKRGVSPYGQAWAPVKWRAPRVNKTGGLAKKRGTLTKAGAKQVQANFFGVAGRPLVDKGRLRSSITGAPDARGVTIGTNLIYAAVHQFGARIKPKNGKRLAFAGPTGAMIFSKGVTIPARPFLPITSSGVNLPTEYQRTVLTRIRAHFVNAAKNG
jgi:phage gpG-like protein